MSKRHHNQYFNIDKSSKFIFTYLGIDERKILKHAGLPVDTFEKKHIKISSEHCYAFWEALVKHGNTELPVPLMLDRLPLFMAISVPVVAALSSPNFILFAERLKEYKPIIGPMAMSLTQTEEKFRCEITHTDDEYPLHPMFVAAEFVYFVRVLRHVTNCKVIPLSVTLNAELNEPEYENFFGVKPQFGDVCAIEFKLSDAQLKFSTDDEAVWKRFEPELKQRLNQLSVHARFSEKVRALMLELLPMGKCNVEEIANSLCTSVRTVQRKLKLEGTSYQGELNHCRELLAKHYLSETSISLTEISFLLGFTEPSSFSRAFTLWVGQSPDSYRSQSMLVNAG